MSKENDEFVITIDDIKNVTISFSVAGIIYYLDCTEGKIRKQLKDKQIKAKRHGSKIIIPASSLPDKSKPKDLNLVHSFTIDSAAKMTGLTATALYELIAFGHIKAKKQGRRYILLREDMVNYINNLPDYEPNTE